MVEKKIQKFQEYQHFVSKNVRVMTSYEINLESIADVFLIFIDLRHADGELN